MPTATQSTKRRVIAAASTLFAERGYRGTTVRDIAQRARVNLAAAHYHFGSKETLYIEVLRGQFADMMAELGKRGGRPGARPVRAGRAAMRALLRARIAAMLDLTLGPPPGLHLTLMMREMCDPSAALPDIVDQFIAPLKREMETIVVALLPHVGRHVVELCVFSIVSQVLFYRQMLPAVERLIGRHQLTRAWRRATADHITDFSVGALQYLAGRGQHGGRRHTP
jgi:AcrR family transcriptional regulator